MHIAHAVKGGTLMTPALVTGWLLLGADARVAVVSVVHAGRADLSDRHARASGPQMRSQSARR
ncbi:hypothetical protein MDOR_15780 [Mycolicibacterium doricum]|uniref:Uncharacterized protein n=1 Tax=Mycolicibacterium doricum TaxID=126673 RepID=A0A7I7VQ83_9MYCO|nr:hypothetical protein MDOR_15780 [Mycolicibacterium doricum]